MLNEAYLDTVPDDICITMRRNEDGCPHGTATMKKQAPVVKELLSRNADLKPNR